MRIDWDVVVDHPAFLKIVDEIPDKTLSVQFDRRGFDFTLRNWYAMVVRRQDGEVVAMAAGRLDDLNDQTLAEYWGDGTRHGQQARLYPDGRLGPDHAPGAFLIRGRVAYCGDMYVHPDFRRNGLGSVASRLNLMTGFLQLGQPDFLYALIEPGYMGSNWGLKAGFAVAEPVGVDWVSVPEGADRAEYLCYSSAAQMRRLVDATARDEVGFGLLKPEKPSD